MRNSSAIPDPSGGDCRCLCGSLLARVVAGGVELRCRRCKRTVVVPLEPEQSTRTAAAAGVRRAG
jgi:phage FluMu protein Com